MTTSYIVSVNSGIYSLCESASIFVSFLLSFMVFHSLGGFPFKS